MLKEPDLSLHAPGPKTSSPLAFSCQHQSKHDGFIGDAAVAFSFCQKFWAPSHRLGWRFCPGNPTTRYPHGPTFIVGSSCAHY